MIFIFKDNNHLSHPQNLYRLHCDILYEHTIQAVDVEYYDVHKSGNINIYVNNSVCDNYKIYFTNESLMVEIFNIIIKQISQYAIDKSDLKIYVHHNDFYKEQ